MTYLFITVGILLVVWIGWSFYARSVEQLSYTVIEERDGYEIRDYEPYLAAETRVSGDFSDSINQGFRLLADYIFGNNRSAEKIAMTAPVTEGVAPDVDGEKIAMTAPVTETAVEGERVIRFSMPKKYTRETLPIPNNDTVQIVEVPAQRMAVLRFTGYYTEGRVMKKKQELRAQLLADGISITGEPVFAGYSDPWTFPLLMRNEILISITSE